jgi:hypothetical protein
MSNKTTKPASPAANMTTYLLLMNDGTRQKITCPTEWTVTFGPLMPGSQNKDYNSHKSIALRIRDGQRQKAVFTNVESFRDMSMAIETEVTKTKEETFYRDEDGEKKQVIVQGAIKEWTNPDAPGVREAPKSEMPRYLNQLEVKRG